MRFNKVFGVQKVTSSNLVRPTNSKSSPNRRIVFGKLGVVRQVICYNITYEN